MGYFSWLTSDRKEGIRIAAAGEHPRPVYLLQPGGQPPIEEPAYAGYGEFGGENAYRWLARMNLPADKLAGFTPDELYDAGVSLEVGTLLRLGENGRLISVFHGDPKFFEALGLDVYCFKGTWDAPIPEFKRSANELVKAGLAKIVRNQDVFPLRYPLKFSFDRKASYEDLPAAEVDPNQGFY